MMFSGHRIRILPVVFAGLLTPLMAAALPQGSQSSPQDSQSQQSSSLADAARRAREHAHETEQKSGNKQPKVITNDDLDTEYFKPGSEGLPISGPAKAEVAPPPPSDVAAVEAKDEAKEAKVAKEKRENPEIGGLKEKLDLAKEELKVLQQEFALDQSDYYSHPDYALDTAGKAKLDAKQQQIADKQQEIEKLEARMQELKEAEKEKAKASSPQNDGGSETVPPSSTPTSPNPPETL